MNRRSFISALSVGIASLFVKLREWCGETRRINYDYRNQGSALIGLWFKLKDDPATAAQFNWFERKTPRDFGHLFRS